MTAMRCWQVHHRHPPSATLQTRAERKRSGIDTLDRMRFQPRILFILEKTGARQEPQSAGPLQRKHSAISRHSVDDQLRVLPVLELRFAHVERHARNRAEFDIGRADHELTLRKHHWCAAVTASTGLMEQN